eukprot:CAMPEP_0116137596 /NCGR_PEP_ID=MMETSP0329-20121206/12328_1 /TAXON_ID=697910 /ORGANISM="Pseudo-nitzschia arenysensis, Strain B593" /LENGTH=147 /DNA_ID=CAMNT_0003632513 /DNA_START=110 /DNA_END=553 /DNA_ORIENTATION=+
MSDSIQASNGAASIPPTAADANNIAVAASNTTTSVSAPTPSTNQASATMTMTMPPQTQTDDDGVLRLTLRDRSGVRWDEAVVDNEGMGRKSSKRCCIFHKPRAFGESSTDSSDYDSDNENGKYSGKKIAHKKHPQKKKLPDHLRFHA